MTVCGAQVVQHEQRADAVRVLGALLRQPGQFAVPAARVLLLGCGLTQHRPHALTAAVAQQHRQQLEAIKPVGLGAPGSAVHFDAGGVDHDVIDALLDQPPVQPPFIAAGLVARVHHGVRLELAARLGLARYIQDRLLITGVNAVLIRRVVTIARRHLPLLVTELEAHAQVATRHRIRALQDCLGRRHFRIPLRNEVGNPYVARSVSRSAGRSIHSI